jgi:divalent metal cation (Fe/Co/Zn/Cd) transporter
VNLVVYRALTHDSRIQAIDTCRVYHSGEALVVEVDIVLPREMKLETAHGWMLACLIVDIGQELQDCLEEMEGVERAFVHLGLNAY